MTQWLAAKAFARLQLLLGPAKPNLKALPQAIADVERARMLPPVPSGR
ncbi:MAG: hypothetical protein ABWY04_08295 [Arthrobacter sp.]